MHSSSYRNIAIDFTLDPIVAMSYADKLANTWTALRLVPFTYADSWIGFRRLRKQEKQRGMLPLH